MAGAGAFKYIVKIYNKVSITDRFGDVKDNYEFVKNTKAAINWTSSNRDIVNNEIQSLRRYDILMHTYVPINNDTHIEVEGKMFRVVEWQEDLTYRDIVATIEEINE